MLDTGHPRSPLRKKNVLLLGMFFKHLRFHQVLVNALNGTNSFGKIFSMQIFLSSNPSLVSRNVNCS